jgi:hypothetical protein
LPCLRFCVRKGAIVGSLLSGALLWLYTETALPSSRLNILAGLLQVLLMYALKIFVEVVSSGVCRLSRRSAKLETLVYAAKVLGRI